MNEDLKKIIDDSKRIVFFGGAGVSTESGIPDFRSKDGLYHQKGFKYDPEFMLSRTFFDMHPDEFFEFYRAKMIAPNDGPSAVHYKLAELEKKGKLSAIVTQNIDGLHQLAGSKNVLELHGSVMRNYCMNCGAFYDLDYIRSTTGVPRCPKDNGIIKPDVVLYEEPLNDHVLEAALRQIQLADTLIIAGTSLAVYPAASLTYYFNGKHLVVINKDATPQDNNAELVIHDRISNALI
jgi:NAD-dependent deacetylase